jgi:3-dehydroquinate dehydratase
MISQTLDGIENSLDILEERCDTLEDNGVDVESFKNQLSKLWDEHEKLVESLYIS